MPTTCSRPVVPLREALTALLVAATILLLTAGPASALPTTPTARLSGPTGWPLAGEPTVVAGFDPPASSYGRGHRGVDLAGRVGEPVLAVAAGTVTFAGSVAGTGVVVVDHGGLRSTYQPVRAGVAVGARVGTGDRIATLLTGHCPRAACLHWGVLRGEEYLDPLSVVRPAPPELRLLPSTAVAQVQARSNARTAATNRAATGGPDPVFAISTVTRTGSAADGLLRPVAGPVSSPFGHRQHPLLHVWKLHDGTDFAAPCGTPIRAPAAGVVTARYFSPGYGNRLLIDHQAVDGRHLVTAMNHAAGYSVGVGEPVAAGQVVGSVGSTGYSTGCHLHFMTWLDGSLVDPESVLG